MLLLKFDPDALACNFLNAKKLIQIKLAYISNVNLILMPFIKKRISIVAPKIFTKAYLSNLAVISPSLSS